MKIDRIKNSSKLGTDSTRLDIRRDIHVFVSYVQQRTMKRGHRDNGISKSDVRRLAKLLSDPQAEFNLKEDGHLRWLNIVDHLAHELGLVHYDTQGVYAGYTSREPSFPDNYIKFDEKAYDALVSMNVANQEKLLFETLLNGGQGCGSEFFSSTSGLGRLSRFRGRGCAVGVVPVLDFVAIRRFLFGLLARCPTGEWLSVASFVNYLKTNHRYFVIPKRPKVASKWDDEKCRYSNFRESKQYWGEEIEIKESDPDAFERVEGRYVEWFLEDIPNFLGYVDVAYGKTQRIKLFPPRGELKAFRVSELLKRALDGTIAEPQVQVTPSFDVYLQSEIYPARAIQELRRICEHVTEDTTNVFRLERKRVATACADDDKLDVVALLESLTTEPLPANVRRELMDWAAHSDKFILYSGCSLLETNKQDAEFKRYRVTNVSPGVDVVSSPARLFRTLEEQQLAPLRIKHDQSSFSPLPAKCRSAFAKTSKVGKRKRKLKTKVTLMRVTRVQLLCPDQEFLERMQRLLADKSCPVEADRKQLSLVYSKQQESEVNWTIRELKKEYEVEIDDQ